MEINEQMHNESRAKFVEKTWTPPTPTIQERMKQEGIDLAKMDNEDRPFFQRMTEEDYRRYGRTVNTWFTLHAHDPKSMIAPVRTGMMYGPFTSDGFLMTMYRGF